MSTRHPALLFHCLPSWAGLGICPPPPPGSWGAFMTSDPGRGMPRWWSALPWSWILRPCIMHACILHGDGWRWEIKSITLRTGRVCMYGYKHGIGGTCEIDRVWPGQTTLALRIIISDLFCFFQSCFLDRISNLRSYRLGS